MPLPPPLLGEVLLWLPLPARRLLVQVAVVVAVAALFLRGLAAAADADATAVRSVEAQGAPHPPPQLPTVTCASGLGWLLQPWRCRLSAGSGELLTPCHLVLHPLLLLLPQCPTETCACGPCQRRQTGPGSAHGPVLAGTQVAALAAAAGLAAAGVGPAAAAARDPPHRPRGHTCHPQPPQQSHGWAEADRQLLLCLAPTTLPSLHHQVVALVAAVAAPHRLLDQAAGGAGQTLPLQAALDKEAAEAVAGPPLAATRLLPLPLHLQSAG